MNNLISVIVPVYNGEKYIRDCIESVISQSYKDIELILINDGSTDRSGQICNEYGIKDGRVKVIDTPNNGPAQARNIGIENSKGSFIFFIDADDVIKNNALGLLMESYDRCKADLIIGDFKKIKQGDTDSGHNRVFESSKLLSRKDIVDYTRCYLKRPNKFPLFVYSWGRLFKSSIIKDNNILFNPYLRTFEDVSFNFNYLRYARDLFFLKSVIYNHLVNDNYASASMMISDNPQDLFGYKQALANVSDFLKGSISAVDNKKEIGHTYTSYTIIQLIRTCGQINQKNEKRIYSFVRALVREPELMGSLQFYFPSKGDSKIIPALMKLKLVLPLVLFCKYKAAKRYKKGVAR